MSRNGWLVTLALFAAAGCSKTSNQPASATPGTPKTAESQSVRASTAAVPAAPLLPHRILKKNADGSLEVEITKSMLLPETRTRATVDAQGKTVLISETVMAQHKITEVIVVPPGEDLAKYVSDVPREVPNLPDEAPRRPATRSTIPPAPAPDGPLAPPPPGN